MCFIFHIAQLRCEECYMKTHIAQEVNIAQLEEVTRLTVNRILESALDTVQSTVDTKVAWSKQWSFKGCSKEQPKPNRSKKDYKKRDS